MDSVIGIDLSGISRSARARTVAAEVALEAPLRLVALHAIERGQAGDRQILDLIEERDARVVAIDAPLTLPHSVACGVRECPRCVPGDAHYLTRDVDTLAGGMSASRLAAIAFRGTFLARILRERGVVVIETYPRAVFWALGVKETSGKNPGAASRALSGRIGGVATDKPDELDAIAAALAAAEYAVLAIDGADGTIWRVGPTPR